MSASKIWEQPRHFQKYTAVDNVSCSLDYHYPYQNKDCQLDSECKDIQGGLVGSCINNKAMPCVKGEACTCVRGGGPICPHGGTMDGVYPDGPHCNLGKRTPEMRCPVGAKCFGWGDNEYYIGTYANCRDNPDASGCQVKSDETKVIDYPSQNKDCKLNSDCKVKRRHVFGETRPPPFAAQCINNKGTICNKGEACKCDGLSAFDQCSSKVLNSFNKFTPVEPLFGFGGGYKGKCTKDNPCYCHRPRQLGHCVEWANQYRTPQRGGACTKNCIQKPGYNLYYSYDPRNDKGVSLAECNPFDRAIDITKTTWVSADGSTTGSKDVHVLKTPYCGPYCRWGSIEGEYGTRGCR